MDSARKKTDKMLSELERRIREFYNSNPSLRRMQRKYVRYMESVEKATADDYRAFNNETDIDNRAKLKNVYKKHVKDLTIKNKEYKDILSEFSKTLADVNQQALDMINEEMAMVYAINYNQISVDCKKIGIEVYGEED